MKCRKFMLVLMLAFISIVAVGGCGGTAETWEKNKSTVVESEKATIPEESPALIGKVKEIVGNEVTMFLAQVAQSEGTPQKASDLPTQNQADKGGRPESAAEMKFTEETETFLLPVGVPIVTMQGATNAKKVELTKITKDSILRIWKKDGTISFVQITSSNRSKSTEQDEDNKEKNRGGAPPDMGGGPPGM